MTKPLKIDFVSDISCPWCVIGLRGLDLALDRTRDLVEATLTFQPFELNPHMPAGGQNIVEHVAQKYGSTPDASAKTREVIRARARDVGFTMAMSDRSRIYNTFDAHRLLHWAKLEGKQAALKHALFSAYFTDGRNPSDHDVLTDVAVEVGLDRERAKEVLSSGAYADEVRDTERQWHARGVNAVPAVILNDRYLISGGQPPEVFEQAIREIAAES